MPERATAKVALKACLDIWANKIAISVDHFKTHYTLGMVFGGIEAREANMDLLTAMDNAAMAAIVAVEEAFGGRE